MSHNTQHTIQQLAEKFYPEIKTFREEMHANPELSFHEFETAKRICSALEAAGITYKNGIAGTGIVAEIKGKNSEKKLIALRGDMDALPIQELNDVPYKSKNDGVMHACGHDVHTSCLLGALKILNEIKEEWEGTVWGIFQPGEELLPGGAKLMLDAGIFKERKPDAIFAQHVYPDLTAGQVGFRPGAYMASTDEIYLTVKGKGGHGALPHLNIDPVLAAAHIIVALQQLVSRNAKPNIPSVLSFGKVIANGATNVIPNEVKLEGTFRTMNAEWRKKAHELITQIAQQTAAASGATCEVKIMHGYPALSNDEKLTEKAIENAQSFLGNENVNALDIRMTAEDFAWFAEQYPVCFYRLGTASPDGHFKAGVHNAHFDIDPNALKVGMGLMAYEVMKF
jgi:amidohydrolase